MLGPPLTVTVLVPPALPEIVTPAPLKPLTGSLKTAVKLIGELLVGSAWPAALSIVTVGACEEIPRNRLSRFAVMSWIRGSTTPSRSSPQAQLVVPAPN